MIRMRRKSFRDELLKQSANRVAVGAHAPFFNDNITLFVKLAEYGMRVAFRLQIPPQL